MKPWKRSVDLAAAASLVASLRRLVRHKNLTHRRNLLSGGVFDLSEFEPGGPIYGEGGFKRWLAGAARDLARVRLADDATVQKLFIVR